MSMQRPDGDISEEHWDLGRSRVPGVPLVQVVMPMAPRRAGGRPGPAQRASILLVVDDAPFLVDSVRMALDRAGLRVRRLVHPVLTVDREASGALRSIDGERGVVEAWTRFDVDGLDPDEVPALEADILETVRAVRRVVDDFGTMRSRATDMGVGSELRPLLDWLLADRFVFLAAIDVDDDGAPVPGSGLGLWRGEPPLDASLADHLPGDASTAPPFVAVHRTEERSRVHRPARLTCFTSVGAGAGTRHIAGLLGASAYRASVGDVPVVSDRAGVVAERLGAAGSAHTVRAVRNVLESLPRDLVIETPTDDLERIVSAIVEAQDRHAVRVLAVPGPRSRYATVLVHLPRSWFGAEVVDAVASLIGARFAAPGVSTSTSVDTWVGSGALARIDVVVGGPDWAPPTDTTDVVSALEEEIVALAEPWDERVRSSAEAVLGGEGGRRLAARVLPGVPDTYQVSTPPGVAVVDFERVAELVDVDVNGGLSIWFAGEGPQRRLRLAARTSGPELTVILAMLGHLGLAVTDERTFEFTVDGTVVWLGDLGLRPPAGVELGPAAERRVVASLAAMHGSTCEMDDLHRLVLLGGLDAGQVDVLRAYGRYLRQIGQPFSQSSVEEVLCRHPVLAVDLVALFEARFDPWLEGNRDVIVEAARAELLAVLDAVPGIDDDRVGRALLELVDATVRTNVFRRDTDRPARSVAFKFDPSRISSLPRPRPEHEIWVCSPRVEGVHLRGGRIARGGLRWSDRRDDFRTEVLGLMKAQMVKNALIVPMGAKGGFVVKRGGVIDCYREFIAAMLDLTDDIREGIVVGPSDTVCHDGPDPYLVVAADKGTARLSDTANEIAVSRGFWLGDAFASGGRAGYDHKAMAITARGAWESVRRHADALGLDADHDPLRVVGIGDMSGDVFGNGMLCSPHLRLVAAFDHRHVFIDPDPDPAASFAERRRLFDLASSSWDDYDRSVVSAGGGVFPRTSKSIRLSAEARAALDVDAQVVTADELVSAVLRAPVDLLWNGGIGTYVKASAERHADIGDRTNDGVRVDAVELRCSIVAEGGNLGFTQLGRVEFARCGGRINTDAIDNSAGVDCSDHEVNLKILLAPSVESGRMSNAERDDLLVDMTDDVAELVLANNRAQTLALTIARSQAFEVVDVHARYLRLLEAEGWLDRQLEFLPSDDELATRAASGHGLTPPEMAVLLAYTKWADVAEVLASDLPEDRSLADDLVAYFPGAVRDLMPDDIRTHRLRREILATTVVNEMVNLQGISFDHRMAEETALGVADIVRGWVCAREVLDLRVSWAAIDGLGPSVSHQFRIELFVELRRLVERVTLWFLRGGLGRDIAHTVTRYRTGFAEALEVLPGVLGPTVAHRVATATEQRCAAGLPPALAERSATWGVAHVIPDLVDLAHRHGRPVETVGRTWWDLFERLELVWLADRIDDLGRSNRWESQARSALRADLVGAVTGLADAALRTGRSAGEWLNANEWNILRLTSLLREVQRTTPADLATLSVAVRQIATVPVGSSPVVSTRP
jgi:glutamate dehydrogenase